jgi:hypothetical protein
MLQHFVKKIKCCSNFTSSNIIACNRKLKGMLLVDVRTDSRTRLDGPAGRPDIGGEKNILSIELFNILIRYSLFKKKNTN